MMYIALNKSRGAVDCQLAAPRYIEVEVSGYKAVFEVSRKVTDAQIQEALDWAYSMLVQSCYVEYILADNFLILSKEVFAKKKILRFNVKKYFNDCQSNIRTTMKLYEKHMDDEYYNEYSAILYDKVSHIVENMRKLIEDKLRNLSSKCNPYLASYAIMIQNLVQQVDDTYDNVMGSVKKRYDVDLSQAFDKHRSRLAFTMADNLLYAIMQGDAEKFADNILKNKKITALWSEITKQLYDPKNVKEARLAAFYNMPPEQQALYNLREDGFCELKEGVKRWKKGE